MKKIVLVSLFISFLNIACQKKSQPVITMPVEKYKLLTRTTDDLVELKKQWNKSKVEIEIDFNSGEFKGTYKDIPFEGKFDILKVSSGFVKGFNYKVELAFLSKEASEDIKLDALVEKLSKCKSIFVSPNRLLDSQFVTAEFKTANENEKLMFVLLK